MMLPWLCIFEEPFANPIPTRQGNNISPERLVGIGFHKEAFIAINKLRRNNSGFSMNSF